MYLAGIIAIVCTCHLPGKASCFPTSTISPSMPPATRSNATYSWTNTKSHSSAGHTIPTSEVIADLVASIIGLTAAAVPTTTSASQHISQGQHDNASVDTCWSQWVSYWNETSDVATQTAIGCSYWSTTNVDTDIRTSEPGSTYLTTISWSSVYTNGPFTTSVLRSAYTTTISILAETATTNYYTETDRDSSCKYVPVASTITQPPCPLPTYVPKCQAAWEAFTASGFRTLLPSSASPQCSQASMNAKQCSWFQSSYVQEYGDVIPMPGNLGGSPMDAPLSRGYAVNKANGSNPHWTWPTQTTLAPSCTLGCARCAVTGGTIPMLYWPKNTANPPSSDRVIATFLNTTLTYPTVGHGEACVHIIDPH